MKRKMDASFVLLVEGTDQPEKICTPMDDLFLEVHFPNTHTYASDIFQALNIFMVVHI